MPISCIRAVAAINTNKYNNQIVTFDEDNDDIDDDDMDDDDVCDWDCECDDEFVLQFLV